MLIHTFGDPDEYFSEMIHAPSLLAKGSFESWYLRANPIPEKLVWQLTSPKAEAFVQALPLVLQQGGIGIDLNMGCAAPPIVRSGAGFAWMMKPLETTAAAVRAVKKALENHAAAGGSHFRLSVKMRLGTTADYPFLLRFCTMLIDEGVELITLHPRLQRQSYARPALHEYTAALAKDLTIPVYGNGDIDSVNSLAAAAERYPCAGWMLGRAAVRMPWIFKLLKKALNRNTDNDTERMLHPAEKQCAIDLAQSPEKQPAEKPLIIDVEQTALLFLQFLKTEQPPEFYLTRAQRFFQFYCDNFSFAHYCKTQLLNAESPEEMEHILHTYFEQVPQDRFIHAADTEHSVP